jgi:glyceraldehyde 3-phosphate dehydrogenase
MINIGINGFGRIGRRVFRLAQDFPQINIVAINDLADAKTLTHLLKYDSIHGPFPKTVSSYNEHLEIEGRTIPFLQYSQPSDIPWSHYGVDLVVEATGKFKDAKQLEGHLRNGAKRVILSVPPTDEQIKTVVLGINDSIIEAGDQIISNASCTTNNAAPMMAIIDKHFGIRQAYITTVHSYTTDQSLHDVPHKDLRRARAAGQSIVPTTTGAAKALTKIFPHLAEVIGGCGIRVPVANGSLTDMTINVKKEVSIKEVNSLFKEYAENTYKGILQYTEDPIVSVDIIGNRHSCIFDAQMTSVIGNMVKMIGWYDNETGYASRILDLVCNLSGKK